MCLTKYYFAAAFGILLVASIAPARADYINGIAWSVPSTTAGDTPTLGNTPGPGATEEATFTANGIDFSGDLPGGYNLGGFLAYGGDANNITYMNGATASTGLDDTLWEFTGMAYFTNGATFDVTHDDGVNLYVNSTLVLGAPDPTSPIQQQYTYTGPTGNESFDFIYTECCGGTADFQTTLVPVVSATPEPGTFASFGFGAALVFVYYRKRTTEQVKM